MKSFIVNVTQLVIEISIRLRFHIGEIFNECEVHGFNSTVNHKHCYIRNAFTKNAVCLDPDSANLML